MKPIDFVIKSITMSTGWKVEHVKEGKLGSGVSLETPEDALESCEELET